MSTPKTKSPPSNLQLVSDKEAAFSLERLIDSVVMEVTAADRSALQLQQLMESNNEFLNINSLPDEMVINIFSYLPQNKLGQIARVCRRWNVLTRSTALWKAVDVKFHKSHKSQNTVTKDFVKLLPPCTTRIRLDFGFIASWPEKLNFEELCVGLQRRCPHLEMLMLKGAKLNSLAMVINLCTLLQNLKTLIFHCSTFESRRPTGEFVGTSKIEVLDFWYCFFGLVRNFSKLPFSRMPCLKQLHSTDSDLGNALCEGDISFLNQLNVLNLGCTGVSSRIFQVVRDHGLNLKVLCLSFGLLKDGDLNINISMLPQLKTICLRRCRNVTCKGVVSLIQSCQSLQNVYVDKDVAVLYATHPFIVANKCKLEIVKFIPGCYDHRRDINFRTKIFVC